MPRVVHANLTLYLTGRFRSEVKARPEPYCSGVTVSNKEPDAGQSFPKKLIVVRDDGGPDTSLVTGERLVGVSVLCDVEMDADDLALMVHAIGRDLADNAPGNPIAAVLDSNGPFAVPETQPRFRRYMTFNYSVVGTAL